MSTQGHAYRLPTSSHWWLRATTSGATGAVVAGLLVLAPGQALAAGTTYTVNRSTGCKDARPAGSPGPYCTIGAAIKAAASGDTVEVMPGTYHERVDVKTARITLLAPRHATIDGSGATPQLYGIKVAAPNVTVDGFRLVRQRASTSAAGLFVDGAAGGNGVTVRNVVVTGSAGNGIRVTSGSRESISHVTISGSARAGVLLQGTSNSTVSWSETFRNQREGVSIQGGSGDLVEHVRSHDNVNHGINPATGHPDRLAPGINVTSWVPSLGAAAVPASNITVQRNTTYANDDSGIQVYGGSRNITVRRNLTYGNGDHGVDFSMASTGAVVANTALHNFAAGINIESSATKVGAHASVRDNLAVDNGNGDGTATPLRTRGDIRVDAPSVAAGSSIDYDLVYDSKGRTVITWGTATYTSLASFHKSVASQERHGRNSAPKLDARYVPRPGSPAIDAANAGVVGWLPRDLTGHRPVNYPAVRDSGTGTPRYADLGAFELTAPPPTAVLKGGRGRRGVRIGIDARGSHANAGAHIVSYKFWCGPRSIGIRRRARATCTFRTLGVHRVSVLVKDSRGRTDRAFARVRVVRGR